MAATRELDSRLLANERYDSFVACSPQRILFCRTWWLDAVAPGQYKILTVERAGAIRAAWPIVLGRSCGTVQVQMPPLTHRLGILFGPSNAKYAEQLSEEHRLIEALIRQLPVPCHLSYSFHESFHNWLPFYWNGLQQTTRYTYVLQPLTDTKSLWDNLRFAERTVIRKARKEGIQSKVTDDLDLYYAVSKKTYARQGMRVPYSLDLLARIDGAARQNAARRLLLAEDSQGRVHACEYIVYDGDCAISLLAGADPALRSSGAQALLKWDAIALAAGTSRRFDFSGSIIRGVELAMRGFGAVQTPYFHIWGRPAMHERRGLVSMGRQLAARALRKIAGVLEPK